VEIIGGVGIEVVADYSGLQSDFDAAQALAQQAGAKIADGIATGFVAPDTQAIAGSLQEVTQQATSAGQAIQQALDVHLPSLDASPVIESFQAITDAAGSAAASVSSAFADTSIPAMDPSAAVAGFQAVDDAAKQAAGDIAQEFSGAAIPATDNTQIVAGFAAIEQAAQQASGAVAEDFSGQSIPASDDSAIIGEFASIQEAAAQSAGAVSESFASASIAAPDDSAILAEFVSIDETAQKTAAAVTQDFQESVIAAPDDTAIMGEFVSIQDAAAQSAAAVTDDFSGTVIPAPDDSAIMADFVAIDAAAKASATEVGEDFSGLKVPAADTSATTDSLAVIGDAAQAAATEVVQDFANVQIPALDTTAAVGGLQAITEEAGKSEAALSSLGAQATQSVTAAWIEKAAQDLAALGGEAETVKAELAAMLEGGASTGEAYIAVLQRIDSALQPIQESAQQASDGVRNIADELSNAAPKEQEFSEGAQAIIEKQSQLAENLKNAQSVLAEMQSAFESGAVGEQELARAAEEVSNSFQQANPQIKEAAESAESASEKFASFAIEALKLAGITLSIEALKELAVAAIEAGDKLDDAAFAMSKFTGSVEASQKVIEGLKAVAQDEGLSFPKLVTAAQRMEALLPAGTDVVNVLGKVGNAAELMGTSIDAAANKFDNLVRGSSLSAKQLANMGLSMADISGAMEHLGASSDVLAAGVKKAWAAMDDTQHAAVVSEALTKLDGVAKEMNADIGGDVTRTMNEFYITLAKLGDVIAPLARQALPYLVDAIKILVTGVDAGVTSFKVFIDVVTAYAKVLGTAYAAVAEAAIDVSKADFSSAAVAISSAFGKIKDTVGGLKDQIQADFKAGAEFAEQVWNVSIPNSVAAGAKKVTVSLADVQIAHKDLANSIAAAFAQIDSLEAKIGSGAGVKELQAAFENAEKAINTVAKEDLPAAIKAVDDYTDAQGRNKAGGEVFLQAFQEQSKLIQQLAKVDLPAASQAMVDYIGKLDNAKAPLGVIQAALEQEEKMIQQLAKQDLQAANDAWDRLIQKLRDTNAPLVVLNQALQDHMKFLSDTAAAADKAQAAFDKVAASYINLATHSPAVQQAFKDAYDTLNKLGLLLPQIPAPMDALNKAMSDFGLVMQKAKTPVEDLKTPIEQLTVDLDKLAEKAKSSGDWSAFNQALDDLDKRVSNLAKTDLPEAAKQLEAVIQEMIKAGAPTDLVQGQLAKLQPLLQKMAEENLPGAAAAWAKYIDLLKQVPSVIQDIQKAQEQQLQKDQQILDTMKARGDAYGYILDQQAKVYQEQIAYDEKTGKSAEAAIMGLEAVRLKQEEIRIETHGLADTYVEMTNEINNAFAAVSKGLADAIINGKSAADALANVFKALAQQILTTMIEGALKPLKASLLDLEANLFDKFKPGMDASTQGIKDFSDASAKAADAQKNLGATATQAAQAVSNLASTISIITGIIAAGAAVAADILLAHISSDTGHIEVNTRSCLAELENIRADLWSQFGQMYSRLGEVMNAVNRVYDQLGKLTIAAGGLSPADSANLADADKQLANMPAIVSMLAAIQANTQYTNANAAQTAANVVDQTNTLYDELAVINNSVLAVVTALTYGTHAQSEEMSDQSEQISSAVEDAAQATSQAIGDSAQMTAQAISSADNHRTADDGQIIARQNAILAQAQSQYQAALDANSQMQALRAEYGAYQNLQAQAIKDGDFALAQQYATYAQQTSAQLTSLMGGTEHIASSADSIYNSLGTHLTDVGGYIVSSGQSVVSAVQSSASQISNTVAAGVAATVAAYAVQMGNLISVAGAWGAAGGGTRTGLNGTTGGVSPNLPSGSGGGTVGNGPGLPSQSPDAVNSAKGGNSVGATPVDPVTGKPLTFAPPNIDWTPKVTPKAPVSDQGEVYTSTPGSTSTSSQSVGTPGTGASIDLQINAAAKAAAQAVAPNTARDKNAQGPETNAANFDPVAAAALTGQSVWEALQGHYDAVGAVNRQEAEARAGAAAQAQNTYTSTAGSTSISGTSGPAAPPGYTPSTLPQAMQDAAKATSSAAAAIASASQAADKIATVNAEMVAANKALADATASGDKSKIALAQQQVQSVQQLLSATLASQQQAAAAADKATLNADQQKALSAQLVAAQRALADATASGDKQKMAEAQMQVDSIKQLISAVMNNQTATAPPPTPISNSASVSPAGTNGQSAAFDPAPLYNWLSTIAGWEKTEVDAINGARDMISDRSVWGNNIIANTIADLAPHIDFVADSVVAAINHLGKAWNLPSFDVGGRIHGDQIAKVHDMEWVIPATGPISLPPDIMARIQMPTVPTLPSVPSVPTSIQGGGGDVYINSVNVQANNVDELLREISSRVKTRTGRTAKFSN